MFDMVRKNGSPSVQISTDGLPFLKFCEKETNLKK